MPVLHTATCARLGHENSQFVLIRDPADPRPLGDLFSELSRACAYAALFLGIAATLLFVGLLLVVMLRSTRWWLFASVLYGPVLLYIGIDGLRHPDLHRWIWGSISLVAGAILLAFAASHWLCSWNGVSRERASIVAVFVSCALALLYASVNLPAQAANRVLSDSSLSWTYHRAELKRDPYERIRGYKCAMHAGRCDCTSTDNKEDRGTCGDQRCCYSWDDSPPWMADAPSYTVSYGCFCVSVDPTLCPSSSSFSGYRMNTERSETCP